MKMLNRGNSSSSPVLIMPDGNTAEMEKTDSLVLEQNGIYTIKTAGENGREHSSRVLCQEGWKELYNKVNHFYKEYFQDDMRRFYRVISKDRRKPDGVTYEGVKFGVRGSLFLQNGRVWRFCRLGHDEKLYSVRKRTAV